jgi:hypothetical protein
MSRRRTEGDETWARLRVWTKGQKAAERLSAHILRVEGYSSVDPSHPLGGRDGIKDIICIKNGINWVGASFFPKTQKTLKEVTEKFSGDLKGVGSNNVNGIAFITNQELTLSQRSELKKVARKAKAELDLFHLERVAQILDTPACYGIRLEFLDIEMSKEEQVAFIAARDIIIDRLQAQLERIVTQLESSGGLKAIPVEEIKEFKRILDSIAGYDPFSVWSTSSIFVKSGHIKDLQVPLKEIREFEQILNRIVRVEGYLSPLSSLIHTSMSRVPAVQDLRVPLKDLIEYENTLNRIIEKLREVRVLQISVGNE